jgi:hypothetical protein
MLGTTATKNVALSGKGSITLVAVVRGQGGPHLQARGVGLDGWTDVGVAHAFYGWHALACWRGQCPPRSE